MFDAFELQRVAEYTAPDGCTYCEVLTDKEVTSQELKCLRIFWTVYGHLPTGGVEALVDRDTEEDATRIFNFFEGLLADAERDRRRVKAELRERQANPLRIRFPN